jgi:hypothetical protein
MGAWGIAIGCDRRTGGSVDARGGTDGSDVARGRGSDDARGDGSDAARGRGSDGARG